MEEHGFPSRLPKVRYEETGLCFLQGKGTGIYEQCYYGPQKQYRVTKLLPASRYAFRLAAKNDMGVRSAQIQNDQITSENGDNLPVVHFLFFLVICLHLCTPLPAFPVNSARWWTCSPPAACPCHRSPQSWRRQE